MKNTLLLLLIFLFAAPRAYAHVFLERAAPRVGEKVAASPKEAQIWFDGYLEPAFSRVEVYDESQKSVDDGRSRVNSEDKTLLETGLPPLPPGKYKVVWIVVGLDGHRLEGDFWFTIKGSP